MINFEVDELKLYMGNEIKIAEGVVLKCPTIGEIVDYGESRYFSMAQTLCATPSSMKVALDDMRPKIDWMKISDFQLFVMLAPSLPQQSTKILLGDLDLSSLKPFQLKDSDEIVLSNEDHTITIHEAVYETMVTYLRKMHGFKKQVDKAGNAITHRVLIDLARQDAKMAQNKPSKSFLLSLISAVKCRMGYTIDYVKQMGIFEFMSDLSRLNLIVQADAALGGMYSGFVDTKKMDKTILDWTRDITEETNNKNLANKELSVGGN